MSHCSIAQLAFFLSTKCLIVYKERTFTYKTQKERPSEFLRGLSEMRTAVLYMWCCHNTELLCCLCPAAITQNCCAVYVVLP